MGRGVGDLVLLNLKMPRKNRILRFFRPSFQVNNAPNPRLFCFCEDFVPITDGTPYVDPCFSEIPTQKQNSQGYAPTPRPFF